MIQQLRTRHRAVWPVLTLVAIVILALALSQRLPNASDADSFSRATSAEAKDSEQ